MTIDLSPIINGVLIPLLTPIIVGVFLWLAYRLQDMFHLHVLDGRRSILETAITNGVNLATQRVAASGPITVSTKNAIVSQAAAYVTQMTPDTVKKLGLDKDAQTLATAIEARLPAQ